MSRLLQLKPNLKIIGVQVLGIAASFLWVFPVAFVMFKLIDKTVGLRVSPEEEMEGFVFVKSTRFYNTAILYPIGYKESFLIIIIPHRV